MLLSIFSPYTAPTAQTKSLFDTKTSAINVTPSAHTSYDIAQVKEDALWLSKTIAVDEVAALRITVLEWQTRSATQLLRGDPQDMATSLLRPGQETANGTSTWHNNELPKAPDATNTRHMRLLDIYQTERLYLLKTTEYILSRYVCRLQLHNDPEVSKRQDPDEGWLSEVGEAIFLSWKIEGAQISKGRQKDFVALAADALRSRLEGIAGGCPWVDPTEASEETQATWAQNQTLEMIHIMQITLDLLEHSKSVLTSRPVLAWFRLMSEICFFDGLRSSVEDFHNLYDLPLQSLAILTSLALLGISTSIELMSQTCNTLVPSVDPTELSPYVHNPQTINELNDILIALAPSKVASPVTLAWGIITQSIREMALSTRESKENRQSLRAADRYGATDSSDTDGAERHPLRSVSSLRRRSSTGSDTSLQSLLVEDVYDALTMTSVNGDPISYLARSAVDHDNVFDVVSTIASDFCTVYGFEHNDKPGQNMRIILLDLVRSCVDFVQYQPALINTTMAVLTGSERFWDLLDRDMAAYEEQPPGLFIRDQALRQKLLLVAASRFPYESVPFLEFCRALAFQYTSSDGSQAVPWANLEELDTFTCRLPASFEATSPIREEEEGDFLRLTETLRVLVGSGETDLLAISDPSQTSSRAYLSVGTSTAQVAIPAGTTGIVQSESKPFVIGWNHQYPGLAYMGQILKCASATSPSMGFSAVTISPIVVAEVIHLISILLVSATKSPSVGHERSLPLESAQSILGQASDGLDRNQDIISVIFEIFDDQLHKPQEDSPQGTSYDILIQCIHFTNALLLLMPDRVWPFLGRSGLLGIGQEEDQLSWVIAHEMSTGRYGILLGCVRLYDALVEDAVSHGVSRKVPMKALVRFEDPQSVGSGVTQMTMQNVLLSFSRSMVDVLESTASWRFTVPADRMEINQRLCCAFGKILMYCYSVNDNPDVSQKITCPLSKAAGYISEAFLSTSNSDFIVKSLLRILASATDTRTTTLPTSKHHYQIGETVATLDLATTLLRINSAVGQSTPQLEKELFKVTPNLARIYAVHECFRVPVVKLFDTLLSSSATSNRQPPSLLGYLGHEGANCFLEVLSRLDQPLRNDALSAAIWSLLTAVVSKRQQWFAMYILTGRTPRESVKSKTDQSTGTPKLEEPILNVALNNLCSLERINPSKALGMLRFVATSADYWPWTFTAIDQHPHFLRAISEYAARVGSSTTATSVKSTKTSQDYNSIQMASYMAKILAMYTHYTRQIDNPKFARGLVPHLNYLIKNAISAPGYNNSLHGNLRTNFGAKFPGCNLTDFKRTELDQVALGEDYFYNVEFADKVLSNYPAWRGKKGQGFLEEFKRANINLSVVEAHVVSTVSYFLPTNAER